MQVSYRYKKYELTFFQFLCFQGHQSWFFFRRVGRGIKRNLKRLALWIAPTLVFSLVAFLALKLLVTTGQAKHSEAVAEFVYILLSSVALLYIKDSFDFERSRRETLYLQAGVCTNLKFEFSSSLSRLFHLLSITDNDIWGVFDRPFHWHSYDSRIITTLSEQEVNEIQSVFASLELALRNLQNLTFASNFIDFHRGSQDGKQISDALRHVVSIQIDPSQIKNIDINSLVQALYPIVRSLRRPWHYANDEARHQMIERLLNEKGVEIPN